MMFDVPQCDLISETKGEDMTLVAKNNPVATASYKHLKQIIYFDRAQ